MITDHFPRRVPENHVPLINHLFTFNFFFFLPFFFKKNQVVFRVYRDSYSRYVLVIAFLAEIPSHMNVLLKTRVNTPFAFHNSKAWLNIPGLESRALPIEYIDRFCSAFYAM